MSVWGPGWRWECWQQPIASWAVCSEYSVQECTRSAKHTDTARCGLHETAVGMFLVLFSFLAASCYAWSLLFSPAVCPVHAAAQHASHNSLSCYSPHCPVTGLSTKDDPGAAGCDVQHAVQVRPSGQLWHPGREGLLHLSKWLLSSTEPPVNPC